MRILSGLNPANFVPTVEQVALIKVRQTKVKAICRRTFRDTAFSVHAFAGQPGTLPGVIYTRPIMFAKAAMVNAGRNLLNHWTDFEIEMAIPWSIHADMMFVPSWLSVGSAMEGAFYRTNMDGTLLSSGLWTPETTEMDGFAAGVVSGSDALNWLGEIGGSLSHIDHPHGTLKVRPKSIEIAAGVFQSEMVDAVFGEPPYTPTLDGVRPAWITLDSANKSILLHPPVRVLPGEYTFDVTVTDAVPQSSEATWTVTISAP